MPTFTNTDLIFAASVVGSSLFSFVRFVTSTAKKGPIPVNFDWWGVGALSIPSANLGAAIYPLIVTSLIGAQFFQKKSLSEKLRSNPTGAARYLAASTAIPGENKLKKFVRFFDRSFILNSCSCMVVLLQHLAQEISLGNRPNQISANFIVRPLVLMYAGIVAAHYGLGTEVLLE